MMDKKRIIFSLLLGLYTNSFAQEWIQQNIDLTINTKFTEAESLLISKKDEKNSSIPVHFYLAALFISKMTHFENNAQQEEFTNAINYVVSNTKNRLKREDISKKEKAQMLFYLGSACGYLAFYQERIGEWFSAINNGKKAHGYLLEVIENDSTLWDAYLGLGSYKYWLSTKISWIPFIEDERETGIQLILKTINKNTPSRPLAVHQLIYILLDYGDYELAERLADEIIIKYPQSQFMYWAYSHVFMKKKDYSKAIMAYQKLLDLIESDPHANPNHKNTCLARMMDMHARSTNCSKAMEINRQLTGIGNIGNNREIERLLEEVRSRCSNSN